MVPASGRVCVVIGPSVVGRCGRDRRPRASTSARPGRSRVARTGDGTTMRTGRRRACRRGLRDCARCPPKPSSTRSTPSSGPSRPRCAAPSACSPGAGTGKTRAITHRIAYGIQVGAYRPANVLAVTFTARAAGEMRTRLRLLGALGRPGPHVPRGRAAPARLLLAQGRRRCRRRGSSSRRCRLVAHAAQLVGRRDGPGERAGPGLGDRVGQGLAGHGRRLREGGRRDGPARPGRHRPAVGRPADDGLRDGQGPAGRHRLRGRAAPARGDAGRAAGRRRLGARAVPALRRRRVPGRQPAAAVPARPVARAVGRSCAWSATRARPSTRSPAPPPHHLTTFTADVPAGDHGRAGPRLPLDAAGGGAGQPRDARVPQGGRPGAARAARAAARTARTSRYVDLRRRRRRGGRRHRRDRRRWSAAGCAAADIAVLFRTNVQSEAFEAALADRGIATRCAGTPGSSPARTCARRWSCCAAGRAPRTRGRRCRSPCGTSCAAPGWTDDAAGGPGREPRALGRAAGTGLARRRPRRGPADGRRAADRRRPRRRARRARRRAARADRRGRDARVAARRQGPRVGRRVPRRALRRSPADRPGADGRDRRRGAAPALRRDHPRARAPAALVLPGPAPAGPRDRATCRGSSRTCGPTSAARPGVPRRELDGVSRPWSTVADRAGGTRTPPSCAASPRPC